MATVSVPTLELEGPAGRRVVVAPRSGDDRVGDLADALGVEPGRPLELDGRGIARHETLARAGVVRGSRLQPAGPAVAAGEPGDAVVTAVCEAGPAAGRAVALPPGRHVVGRAPHAAVRVDDPHVEPHQAVLDIDPDGAATLLQLTGRVPCRIDGEPVTGPVVVPDGGVLTIGASRVRVGLVAGTSPGRAAVAPLPDDPWRRTLRRTPRLVPRWDPVPVPIPAPPPQGSRIGATGLVAAGCTAVGAVVVAVVMGSALFLVFAAVGLLAALGMWVASRVGAARDGRRSRANRDRDVAEFGAAVHAQRDARWRHHLATTPGIAEAVAAATTTRADVWCRRAGHDDVVRVSIGWGPVEWDVVLAGAGAAPGDPLGPELAGVVAAAGRFDDAPIPTDLGPGAALAVTGPGADGVARSIIVQLVTWAGPADVQLVVLADDPAAWDWCHWLPHVAGPNGPRVAASGDAERVTAALAGLDDGTGRHVVIITDRADLLSQRTGLLRRFLGTAPSAAVVAVVAAGEAVPAMCRSVLEIGSIGRGKWWADAAADAHPVTVHAAGVTISTALAVARSLAALHDPEDPAAAGAAFPASISLGELLERHGPGPIDDPIAIAAAWRAGGADPAPLATLGATSDGVVDVDLARDGPHALVAGTTGAGKSELLRTLVASLAARCSPDHVTFVLIDYKGGSTFDACADLPHTVGVVTDLDDQLAARALTSLDAEVRRREHVLRQTGAVDLGEHRARGGTALPRLVVVVDEFATLAAELPEFLAALVGIAQRGRSLGIHLVLATQRPAGVVSDDIRNNTNLRVALRLQDVADARDVVGDDGPAGFSRGTPGRAMLRLGPDERVVFQAACSSGPAGHRADERLHVVADREDGVTGGESELAVLVHSIRNAAALSDVAPPFRPWLPPLPAALDAGELQTVADATACGLLDDPAGQRRLPLSWQPDDGNLAIIGAVGSGTTTALRSVAVAACAGAPPAACHLYVIDAAGDARLDPLAALDHCGGVVRLHERERLSRLLRRLVGELETRRSRPDRGGWPAVVLAIDGLPALRTVLDDPLDHHDHERLARIIMEGSAAGIVTVLTAERPSAVPAALLASCAGRWVGHLDDLGDASMVGVTGLLPPAAAPGRVVVAGSRLTAQLADLGPVIDRVAGGAGGPAPLGTLPERVTLPQAATVADGNDTALAIGVDFESLGDAVLHVPDGEHVLVAGPARSGRTTALASLAAAWRAAVPDGDVLVVSPRGRGPWATDVLVDIEQALTRVDGADRPTLLVVDDAERVDDARLAALANEHRPGLLLVAAGRPDALRSLYGHWTSMVRRSRIGILLAACTDIDGDLVGELLPRRPPIPARPGLAWLVDGTGRRLAQLAS